MLLTLSQGGDLMSLLRLTDLFFDTETHNVKLRFTVDEPVSYQFDHGTYSDGQGFYEGELYIDGDVVKVASYRPPSLDGTDPGISEDPGWSG